RVGELAQAARAGLDAYRFSAQNGGTRMRVGFEWHSPVGVFLRMSFAHVLGVPLPIMELEHVTEVEARGRFGLGAGLRLQEVFAPFGLPGVASASASGSDQGQVAVEPFLQYVAPQRGFLARTGLLLAVDPPLGPAVDRGKVATLRVAL